MALSILFFSYPPYPMYLFPGRYSFLFPFSLIILLDAAILSMAVPLVFFFVNLARGRRRFPHMFLGLPVPVKDHPRFFWPMLRLEDGMPVDSFFPRKSRTDPEIWEKLEALEMEQVWATPQIPFMVPLLAGLILAVVVGNPVMALLGGV